MCFDMEDFFIYAYYQAKYMYGLFYLYMIFSMGETGYCGV